MLKAAGISWQSTKTWKQSTDPEFAAKKDRILALYDHPPNDGRVLCVDEFGPLNLMPRPGRAGTHTSSRNDSARPIPAPPGCGRCSPRSTWPPARCSTGSGTASRSRVRRLCKQLRRRFPTGRLYLVCDNYGAHQKAEVTTWCAANDIELVFTPSNASWLNWIECEFTALRSFVLNGSDYPSHAAQEAAIARYLRWRNKHAQPKRRFAIGSKIRQPDYLPLSA